MKIKKYPIQISVSLQLRNKLHTFSRTDDTLSINWAQPPGSTTNQHLPVCIVLSCTWIFVLILGCGPRRHHIWQSLQIEALIDLPETQLHLFTGDKIEVIADLIEQFANYIFVDTL